jgi:hypothetical protein
MRNHRNARVKGGGGRSGVRVSIPSAIGRPPFRCARRFKRGIPIRANAEVIPRSAICPFPRSRTFSGCGSVVGRPRIWVVAHWTAALFSLFFAVAHHPPPLSVHHPRSQLSACLPDILNPTTVCGFCGSFVFCGRAGVVGLCGGWNNAFRAVENFDLWCR